MRLSIPKLPNLFLFLILFFFSEHFAGISTPVELDGTLEASSSHLVLSVFGWEAPVIPSNQAYDILRTQ